MIFDLPDIPKAKHYGEEMTPEQLATLKCLKSEKLTDNEEKVLKESIEFYKVVFPRLKEIDLSAIKANQVNPLKKYLDKVFNFIIVVQNEIHFNFVNRVTIVRDSYLEKGKVRTPSYLTYPPLEVVKNKGVYNRANSPDSTLFYASFLEHVAIRETKPEIGDRIIISTWENTTGNPFMSYPITNSPIENENVRKATNAFQNIKESNHPLFAEILDLILAFLASEFVKDSPINSKKRYEYLYSSYFAEKILTPMREGDKTPNYDFIIYPSIAWDHKHENVVIVTDSVNEKLKLIKATEYRIIETYYDRTLGKDEMPVKLEYIRNADWIDNELLIWDDE